MKTALTIAGSDPSGGAGLQRDLATFQDYGVKGLSAVAALTAQNSSIVSATQPVTAHFLASQIRTLAKEFRIDAVKIGMTGSSENLRTIRALIKSLRLEKVVLDPVLRSTSGKALLDKKGVTELASILPFVKLVTPNLPEAEALTGIKEISDLKGMEEAAERLHAMGAAYALIKGGHLKGAPVDLLFNGRSFVYFQGKRIKGRSERFHGTGCILSAAIAAGLAQAKGVERAVLDAKAYLATVLRSR
ncbi:MAG TPA: bifunctional hydroxymethylpyrimidine kinase/phosphomethylpyrimidine kinase [Deltaproteobacteria bacterium]|nr:MAG: bifunctional hydroxymethylpyrimidine kinase/phosphomethylpyrimidine kinase [Deltaproteobacteria bacterium GWA2_55_82]OGQ64626.1 MAG: bifunctional hydroxymethylpyrimidine kinase/phosphomethylpyrimidine kinase [Deltaproteobacteria bacterium RIFCSPLOWO2_02_FULL_55_12]OIJ73726.1 MAG: bifunctional hydroxymethylpyrimidine kinase/phosphomethylpyrimidine kinase [Deltaproteobacteria bacterium GWC2_55_46]HBG45880.1 bifunctional hydroxymethylpyrimidine kinase/phosphomethylpyrimidine kinase [Deltapr